MKMVRVTTGAALGLWAAASPVAACPTCRDALAASDAKWAHGFSVSVLFLLAVLVVVVGTFSFAVWRATRSPRAD